VAVIGSALLVVVLGGLIIGSLEIARRRLAGT